MMFSTDVDQRTSPATIRRCNVRRSQVKERSLARSRHGLDVHARCAVVSDYAHEGWCSSYQYSPGLEVALKRVVVYARVVDRTPAGVVL